MVLTHLTYDDDDGEVLASSPGAVPSIRPRFGGGEELGEVVMISVD